MPPRLPWYTPALLATLVGCGGDLVLPTDGSGGSGTPGGGPPPAGEPPPTATVLGAADDHFETLEGGNRVLAVAQPGVLANDSGGDGGSLEAERVYGPSHGTLTLDADGSLQYSADPDYFGEDQFTYRAMLGSDTSNLATAVIEVLPVNDSPAFTPGPDQQVRRRAGPQVVVGWATNIRPGPPNESGQQVDFRTRVTAGAKALKGTPSIEPDGSLHFEPSGKEGTAEVEVRLHDDGGTANGGYDLSEPHTLVIRVKD